MKKDIVGIWSLSVGLLLLFSVCCRGWMPKSTRGAAPERFDPAGVWTQQEGNCCRNFYVRQTETGSPGPETRYTVYYRETDVIPAEAASFRETDLRGRQVQFQRTQQDDSMLCTEGAAARCSELCLQPLDDDHVLLLGEAELEGIYVRQGSELLQCWSDWYLLQLERRVKLEGLQ